VSTVKKMLALVLILSIIICIGLGIVWHRQHYLFINGEMHDRDIQTLDLRDQDITLSQYNRLRRQLPDCQILWNIPIQGNIYSQDITTLTLPDITDEDAQLLSFFPQLQTLDVRGSSNYKLLQTIQQSYPQLQVLYTVPFGGEIYEQNAQVLKVTAIYPEELALLDYLPQLTQVQVVSSADPVLVQSLEDLCLQRQIPLQIMVGSTGYDRTITSLTLERAEEADLAVLHLFPNLTQVDLLDPVASAESLRQLRLDMPGVTINWTKTLLGVALNENMVTLDLTSNLSAEGALAYEKAKTAPVQGDRDEIPYLFAVNTSYPLADKTADTARLIAEAEDALSYFPNIKEIVLCGALLDNEAMAAFREAHRQDYRVIWSVQCGNRVVARTDTPYFMPTKHNVYYFLDEDSPNLKYCEEIIALDLGHMAIKNIDFVQYMPNLQYLVLAHTQLQRVEPLSSCKNLKFLELDWSPIRDYTPLKECTSLEDLNLGNTYADFAPVQEMTWLKNLWMIGCSAGARNRVPQSLPETQVMVSGSATVANGWRELPNYYAMRDTLGMFYMEW